jgi:hypothetical protein
VLWEGLSACCRIDALANPKVNQAGHQTMKGLLTLVLMAGLLLAGCKKQQPAAPTTNAASSGNPITAPIDYLGAVGQAPKTATKVVSSAGLQQAIQMFWAQEGRFPKDLSELAPNYIDRLPPPPAGMKYSYDARNGTVKVVAQ